MASDKDVCRICIQEVNYEAAEEIDLDKLRNLIRTNVLPKWKLDDFKDHIICETCLTNCRTLQSLQRLVRSSNATLWNFFKDPPKYKRLNKFDLRLAPRFKDVSPDLDICRCCSEAIRKQEIAVYLYNHDFSLTPVSYVQIMLKAIGLNLRNLGETLDPVMCCKCWQRVQVSYAFRARLKLVKQKINHYRRLLRTTYETRMDLNDIIVMWPNLAVPESLVEDEDSADDMPLADLCRNKTPTNMKNLAINLDKLKIPQIKTYVKKFDLTFSEQLNNEVMPLLTPEVGSEETKKVRKSSRKKTARVINDGPTSKEKPAKTNPRRTRSSLKNTTNGSVNYDSDFNDLLMVTKEEIIKPLRQRRKRKPLPKFDETVHEIFNDAKDCNVQYTFERFNFNEGIVSSDTDDEFVESTGPLNNSNDNCPVISPEPQEILDLDDYDDCPPELELQEPCDPASFVISKPYSVDEKRIDAQSVLNQQNDGFPKKVVGLSVRTDLLQPPSKIVEPLLINLNTMEVSNKPSPVKTVQIHSNEVIMPKYKLRNSEIKANNQNPPPLTPILAKPNEEFKSGNNILLAFNDRPIGSLKRPFLSEDGNSLLPKRPKLTPETNGQLEPAKTSQLGNNRTSLLIEDNTARNGNRGRPPLAKNQFSQKPGPSGTTSSNSNDNRKSIPARNSSQTPKISFTTQKTFQKIAPKPLPPIAMSKPSEMPKLTTYHSQKPAQNKIVPLTTNNLPPNLKNFSPNSSDQNLPLVQKIMFLENGEMVLVDQAIQVTESQMVPNNSPLKVQQMISNCKLESLKKLVKIPEARQVMEMASKNSKASTSRPKFVVNEFILISDDEEEPPNLPSMIADQKVAK